jgi:hypothetical protein
MECTITNNKCRVQMNTRVFSQHMAPAEKRETVRPLKFNPAPRADRWTSTYFLDRGAGVLNSSGRTIG